MKKRIAAILLSLVLFCAGIPLHSLAESSFKLQRLETGFLNQVVPSRMSIQLTPVMKNATSEVKLTWKVNDSSIATVDQNGKLTPKKVGKVKVTATAVGFEQSATTTVTFAEAKLSITGGTPKVLYNAGERFVPEITFTDAQYSDPAYKQTLGNNLIEWSVDNTAAASINGWGQLQGISSGTVNITASVRTADNFSAVRTVQIVNGYIDFSFGDGNPIVDVGFAMQPRIEANVSYVGSDDTVIWESLDGKAEITDLTTEYTEEHVSIGKITFKDSGKAVIRAKLKDDPTVYSDYEFNVLTYVGDLADVIDEAVYGYNIDAYTALRWNNLQKAIESAKAVYLNAKSTQKEINAAIEALRAVMAEMDTPDFIIEDDDTVIQIPVVSVDDTDVPLEEDTEVETEPEKVLKKILMKRPGSVEEVSYLWLYITVGVAAVLLAGGATAAIIIIKRRKKIKASAVADENNE